MFLKSTKARALILLLWLSMAVLVFSNPIDFSINPSSTNPEKLELVQLFEQWIEKHEKIYAQPADKARGFENFVKNYDYVNRWNANRDNNGGFVGLNNLADLSNEEFKEKYLSKVRMGKGRERMGRLGREREYESCNAPRSLNWKKKGVVTAVKNQGQCGSCWSFSSTGAIEGINAIRTGKLISLSEQELVECDKTNSGCNGGNEDKAFKWVIRNGGINTESAYPYTAKKGKCNVAKANKKVVTIDGFQYVPPYDKALLCAVLKQPISVGIDASTRDFQLYTGGIYNGKCSGNPHNIDHAVLLVGYGSANGTDYWIVKNSWGTKWGAQGYIYIKRDKTLPYGKCAILGSASYPTKNRGSFSPISSL